MERNDYDRVANEVQEALAILTGNTHGPLQDTDSVTVTKDGWIRGVVGIQRAANWCRSLADTHWRYRTEQAHERALAKSQTPLVSFDPDVWVDAWIETIGKNPEIPQNRETMRAWFANALMRGYDEWMQRNPGRPEGDPFTQS